MISKFPSILKILLMTQVLKKLFRFILLESSVHALTCIRFFRVRVLVTSFHAQNVSELLKFFGFFALSIFPHGFLSLLQPPASDCSPDINTLEGE